MKKTVAAGLGACAVALTFAAKDPVIMTVNGVDVPKSEFEYLYNKNSKQQINPQTLDEYVEMFKLYKMKVADARAEGIDTLAKFREESEQYRHELAAPYLADSVYINQLVQEAYDRSKGEVEAYHVMLFKTRDAAQNVRLRQQADSLQKVLAAGGDFADIAARYSQDRGSKNRGGRMGWIVANAYPAAFEEVAFALPEGKISDVVESPVGYHVLKGGKHRKARGKAQVAHILKLTQGKDEAAQARAKAEIDSLYSVVIAAPQTFQTVATANSEDRGSARQGGMLPWFGAGEMVEEFDSVAFSLSDGEISKPVKTAYGYHIIKKIGSKDIDSFAEMKPQLVARVTSPQDPRFKMIRARQTERLAKKHKGSLNEKTVAAIRSDVAREGLDSALFANWTTVPNGDLPLLKVDGKTVKAGEFMDGIKRFRTPASQMADETLADRLDAFYNSRLVEAEEDWLAKNEPDYRNLLNEFRDGSLLYEAGRQRVWDRAANDTAGLQQYFQLHQGDYTWQKPRAKGYLIQTVNDSTAALIKARMAQLQPSEYVSTLRKEFGRDIQIDRVLAPKGVSSQVDFLAFDGPEAKPSDTRFHTFWMADMKVLDTPEELSDVRGLVIADYQNYLMQQWEDELREKYPVTVNKAVLSKVRTK